MLSGVREKKMLSLRGVLLALWLILILSLFWDPVTPILTQPDSLWSPFHITETRMRLLGETIPIAPYPFANRLFWTMFVPVIPFFLMVFGHEAWRRMCPLSLASQIPRYLGLQRRRFVSRPGKKEVTLVPYLIAPTSWLAKHSWYVQIGLLFVGLNVRLLAINSDRVGLAIAFVIVIGGAVTTGVLWGGKSWCNYFCPANIVQRIYTEPRAIFESAPHISKTSLPQSMCRSAGVSQDKPACVGCTRLCGDLDLEKSYWETIQDPQRANTYYMFFGLVVGFYGYYWIYAGSWDYYFSGSWTHEQGQLGRMMDPGIQMLGDRIWMPKLVAAPLTLALAAACSLLLGRGLQRLYAWLRRSNVRLSQTDIIHHCLAVSAYVSINTFYVFGGRPSLLLLPALVLRGVDVVLLIVTTLWLWQALQRSPFLYRREGVAASMVGQLKLMNVDIADRFDGRRVEDLRPDEIYVLSKMLPEVSRREKLTAYCNVLHDAISTGQISSPGFLGTLDEFRVDLGISDLENVAAIEQANGGLDAGAGSAAVLDDEERERAGEMYYDLLAPVIADKIELGQSIPSILDTQEIRVTLEVMRSSLYISDAQHKAMLARLVGRDGLLVERRLAMLDKLRDILAIKRFLEPLNPEDVFARAVHSLVDRGLGGNVTGLCERVIALEAALTGAPRRADASGLDPSALVDLVSLSLPERPGGSRRGLDARHVGDADPSGAGSLEATFAGARRESVGEAEISRGLRHVVETRDAVGVALTLAACGAVDHSLALRLVTGLSGVDMPQHWFLAEVLSQLGRAAGQPWTTFVKMVWLSRCRKYKAMPLAEFAEEAFTVAVRRYGKGETVDGPGPGLQQCLFFQSGRLEAAPRERGAPRAAAGRLTLIGAATRTDEDGMAERTVAGPLRVVSDFATVLFLPACPDGDATLIGSPFRSDALRPAISAVP